MPARARAFSTEWNNESYERAQRRPYSKPKSLDAFKKRFFPKSFVVEGYNAESQAAFLSCQVVPAVFQISQNANYRFHSEFYKVLKNGYVVFNFLEGAEFSQQGGQAKRSFVMTMVNVRPFLDIDPDYALKVPRRPGRLLEAEEEVCLSFSRQGADTIQNMRIRETAGRVYEFTYFDIIGDDNIGNQSSIEVRAGDLKVMQTLVKYAMPCLLGWNGALDPKVCNLFYKAL